MRKWFRRILSNNKALTLMECVLASALIGVGSTLVLGMVSMGYSFIRRSRSLDEVSSIAQELIVSYDGTPATEGVRTYDDNDTITYCYSDHLETRMSFEIFYGSGAGAQTDVILPNTMEYVAVVVMDESDNKIVYYLYTPNEKQIRKLYVNKE